MSVAPEPVNPEHDPMTIDPANLGSVDPLSVEGLFLVALGKTGDARAAFLAEQCGDEDRRQRVEALLAAYESAGSFLEKPAIAIEPIPMGQYLAPCEVPGAIGKLGPYEILEEIGRGGMGVVFRAHDPKLQRIVAVKALAPELARLPSARQRFLREARAAAAISHPHVVTIFAVDGTEEASLGTERATLPYLVMECIVGQTLHDKIKRQGALKTEEIVRISRQIAEGLGAAHKRGLIHRDIKPANILLENGVERVKITDFGLARTTSDGGITHTGEILGTPQCMSPEQARGEPVDTRSDLFSLGCVMYTMCTGVNPFRADNMLAVMKKVCEETPRPIAQLNSEIPEWLCSLVHQLLEKQPELRVQTAGEVVQSLESQSLLFGTSPSGPPPVLGSRSRRPIEADAPTLSRWARCQDWLPVVCLVSGLIGFAVGQNRYLFMIRLPIWSAVAWAVLSWAKLGLKLDRSWINWRSALGSIIAIFAGANLRVWMMTGMQWPSAVIPVENFLREHAGWFVLPLAAVIFWLLTKLMPWGFIPARPPATHGATAQPPSPWSFLGWMIVGLIGFVVLGSGLVFFAVAIPWYMSVQKTPTETATVVVTDGPKIVSVYDDGNPVEHLISDANGHQWFETTTGPHNIYIGFESNSTEEKFFHNTVTLTRGRNEIDAQPTTRPRNAGTPLPTLHQAGVLPVIVAPVDKPAVVGQSMTSNPPPGVTIGESASPSPSLPLADAVEVLTDPQTMPAPAMGVSMGYQEEMTQAVWIDEPGLLIRMKRLGFEGEDGKELEYYSKVAWGTGPFMATNSFGEHAHHFPAGRYQVLVQDLDYGWALDRRGTITIGNGPMYIHVKRSFDAHQLHSDGDTQFPVPFRWAGKTYQIHNHEEIAAVNGLLAATVSVNPVSFSTPNSFRQHPLFKEAVEIDPLDRSTRLKRERTLAQIDIQSADMRAGFMSPLGRLEWNGPHKSIEDNFVPRLELRGFAKDELMGWDQPGWYDNYPIATDDPLASPLVVRRDRASVKRFADTGPGEIPAVNFFFYWFGTETDLPRKSAPAIRRLISAWADEHPDVPEAELLPLGGATSFEELWKLPTPAAAIPAVNEKDEPKPEFVHPAFLVPGSTPATWRLKEPPEGAVAEE